MEVDDARFFFDFLEQDDVGVDGSDRACDVGDLRVVFFFRWQWLVVSYAAATFAIAHGVEESMDVERGDADLSLAHGWRGGLRGGWRGGWRGGGWHGSGWRGGFGRFGTASGVGDGGEYEDERRKTSNMGDYHHIYMGWKKGVEGLSQR